MLSGGKSLVVAPLPDGSSQRLRRDWTDADGGRSDPRAWWGSQLSVQDLRELAELLAHLGRRTDGNV